MREENASPARRHFLLTAAMHASAGPLAFVAAGPVRANDAGPQPAGLAALAPIRQIVAGELDVGYFEAGPTDGIPVLLMHGYPYDIHSYVDVAPALAARGCRVIVPYLRGHGSTRFLKASTLRDAQQSAVALDQIALLDALHIERAVMAGYDWGARTACVLAAAWPQRCLGLVSVGGYIITSRAAQQMPAPAAVEHAWWYQYYFATERGRAGLAANRRDIARISWATNSPQWKFDDATFERTAAAFDNPDWVDIVVHNYRWRLGLADGAPELDALEQRLAAQPTIAVPTITMEGDTNGIAPPTDGKASASRFTGPRTHRIVHAGHNLPQEAPEAFAEAVWTLASVAKR
jgi:pimeloyl-ACP methyl ester carboxylesterase